MDSLVVGRNKPFFRRLRGVPKGAAGKARGVERQTMWVDRVGSMGVGARSGSGGVIVVSLPLHRSI